MIKSNVFAFSDIDKKIKRVDKFLRACFGRLQSNQFYVLKCDIYI
jgi:hypothetical protein